MKILIERLKKRLNEKNQNLIGYFQNQLCYGHYNCLLKFTNKFNLCAEK